MTQQYRISIPAAQPPMAMEGGLGDGRVSVNAQYLSVDGVPVFPISGEIHYSRIPRELWDATLRRARAGGLTHVATYAFWNHHEDADGVLSFDADLDLRHFLELAAGHGLGLVLRLGPYVHSESRHGGLPDRIADGPWEVRTNDAGYLAEVERWYAALEAQARGIDLFAVQVDNELYDRPEHLEALRAIAERVGFSAPLWTATAWGGAQLPGGVLPLYGGYTDSFWIEATDLRDERSLTNFYPTSRRDDDGIGLDHRDGAVGDSRPDDAVADHPFATCELGGGMASAYHRRPEVTARDVEALGLAKLASGSVWQGWYMYADGRNPRRGLQEAHAVGAPNDFMELSYDFGAALTLDAVPRETWFRLRRQHLLLQRWGSQLATMPAVLPDNAPDHPDETALRWGVRSDGERGVLVVVNHQPSATLPAHDGVVFALELEGAVVEFPAVDVPPGAAFAWPFGLRLGETTIAWATAQPVTEVTWQGLPLLVLAEVGGIPGQFACDADVVEIDVDGPGRWWVLEVADRAVAHVVILSDVDSLRLGVAAGRLVLADGVVTDAGIEAFATADTPDSEDHLGSEGDTFGPTTYSLRLTDDGWRPVLPAPSGRVQRVPWRVVAPAGEPPTTVVAPNGRASLPSDWSVAGRFAVSVPGGDGTLVLEWTGDVARAWDGHRLVSDAIANGRAWRISAPELAGARTLDIEILPLPVDAPVLAGEQTRRGAALVDVRLEQDDVQPWATPLG